MSNDNPATSRGVYHPLLGTNVEIRVGADGLACAEAGERAALEEMVRLQSVFSVFDPGSDLSRWRAGADVAPSEDLVDVLAAAQHWWTVSSGGFHPATARLRQRWLRAEAEQRLPPARELQDLVTELGELPFRVDAGTATRVADCSGLDLNAIAKGYIVDRGVAAAMAAEGVVDVLVNAGGDLRHAGSQLPLELLTEILRGGAAVAREAQLHLAGGHSIDDPEPKYGLAVVGLVHPDRILRLDAATPGMPINLTKPLGIGVLNNRHKATGQTFPEAIHWMTKLNVNAARAALAAGATAATDITGFGLLGHAYKMARASNISITIDANAVPYIDGARRALIDGYISGGTRRNLAWVRPHVESAVPEDELILLTDAQTSGGLLVVGEVPGYPVIGETTNAGPFALTIR